MHDSLPEATIAPAGRGQRNPRCPRCDYDLAGEPPTWSDACPLDGRCTECGLEFRWRDVISPTHSTPRWSFEHATSNRALRLILTLLRSLWPPALYRSLSMHHPIRGSRLVLFALLLVIGGCAVHNVALGLLAYQDAPSAASIAWNVQWGVPTSVERFGYDVAIPENELLNGLLFPLVKTDDDGPWWWGQTHAWHLAASYIAATLLLTPLAFLLLGQSMARLKIRRAHLLRGLAYSIPILPISVLVPMGLVEAFDRTLAIGTSYYLSHSEARPAFALIPALAMLAFYWIIFASRYLRVPHAIGVGLVMVFVGYLAGVVLTAPLGSLGLLADISMELGF